MTGGAVCVAWGAAATSVGRALCAAAVVDVAMMNSTARLKPGTAFGEQITRTLPFTDSMNHKGGDMAGPAEGV